MSRVTVREDRLAWEQCSNDCGGGVGIFKHPGVSSQSQIYPKHQPRPLLNCRVLQAGQLWFASCNWTRRFEGGQEFANQDAVKYTIMALDSTSLDVRGVRR